MSNFALTLFRLDGNPVAKLTSTGGWLDLVARKLVAAPPAMLAALNLLVRTDDFEPMPSSIR